MAPLAQQRSDEIAKRIIGGVLVVLSVPGLILAKMKLYGWLAQEDYGTVVLSFVVLFIVGTTLFALAGKSKGNRSEKS